jgi:hypothetical protein
MEDTHSLFRKRSALKDSRTALPHQEEKDYSTNR